MPPEAPFDLLFVDADDAKDDADAVVGLLAPGGTAVLDDFWLDPALADPRRDAWLRAPAADDDRALGDAASGGRSSPSGGSASVAPGRLPIDDRMVTWPHSVDDIGGFLITWLPIVFFGIIIWLLLRTMSLVPKVKPAMVDRDTTDPVGWDDVAGADEAKEELKEVVEFLRDRKKFERLGARVPKGVLLYGPPGTGKTLLAKAAANESGANFYSSSASAFVEMFAGLGAARIRKLFEEARKNAPAIIFIDELDAVGTARSGGAHNREHDQTLNQLLVEIDGFGGADEVVIMGASNRLQDLDPALLRPGRFDRQVNVAPPDLLGRERDPPRAHALEAARRGRRHRRARAAHRRPDRRRPREHRERGSNLRGAQRPAVHPPGGLRGRDGARADRVSRSGGS